MDKTGCAPPRVNHMTMFRSPSQPRAAADVALAGDQLVIDVQTHDVADRRIAREETAKVILSLGESVAGDLFQALIHSWGMRI